MKEISVFREKLHEHLQWNRARLLFVSMFLIALMRVKTVNLVEIATGFRGEAKVESHYKRLQRFFREFEVDYESIALMVVKVIKIREPWVISIDRTDWRFGKTRHGKQNYKCRDCGRQFVEDPQWQRVSERIQDTYDRLERLLLEKIPLAGIARVLKVSERWLQKATNSGYGLPLMPRLVKLWVVILAIALGNRLRSYGNPCLVSIVNVRLFTLISTQLIQLSCQANVIGQWVKKRERPTILSDSTVRYDNEYQD